MKSKLAVICLFLLLVTGAFGQAFPTPNGGGSVTPTFTVWAMWNVFTAMPNIYTLSTPTGTYTTPIMLTTVGAATGDSMGQWGQVSIGK